MLQWMGGSRRKVATSRNSTHKRQRQYFEQRKRQQQAARSEGYVDGKPTCSQNCENNRSLDILSLVNVSSIAQEHKTSSLNARDSSNDDDGFAFHHQYACQSSSSHTGGDTLVNPSEPEEETSGTSTSHHSHTGNSKKVLVCLTDPKEHLVGNGNKFDHSMLSPAQQMSVMDLLGDGGANSNAEETSVRVQEAHVAFSVQGLGKVEAKTPVQSPKTPGRFFLKGYSSPKNSWKQPTASKHLDYSFDDLGFQMDVMMQDSEFSPYATSRNHPFCSTDKVNKIGDHPNPKFLNFRTSSPFYWNGSDLKGVLSKDELFSNGRENDRIIWNDPSFLDADVDTLGEYESFCDIRADPSDVRFNDLFNTENKWKKDFNFEDWNLQNKRFSTKQNESFDMADLLLPYPKSKIQHYPDFKIPDTRHTTVQIDDEDRDNSTSFASEDTREMSRLSEESCSSTAVRGDATKKS